jgi:RimJ/RimL family protein N-acetyltransferase
MIYGENIRLRAIDRQDLPRFVEWLNDPEVRRGLLLHLPMSRAEEENWFEDMLKRPAVEHPLVIEIQEGTEWIMIGNCGIHNVDWRCRSAEVGIFIGEKRLWNRGYGTNAMRLLLKHGFETLNLNRIALEVYENNPRAVRSYEKSGFVHEGRKRKAMFIEGKYHDILIMSVLREEWRAS